MKASDVSAVLVTRGNVSLNPILQSLPFEDVVVWDNSTRADLAVYGRYAAIAEAKHDVIFCQDDDCVLAPESFIQLLDAYEPGAVVCNMPERFRHDFYEDHALVGFGALFDRELPEQALARVGITFEGTACTMTPPYAGCGADPEQLDTLATFYRTADVIFTALTPRILVDAPYTDLPWASDPNRMWKQPDHLGERTRMLELVRRVRDGAAA